ncbi:hypothetical protein MRX96_025178 [Rhipicephalus microplus]
MSSLKEANRQSGSFDSTKYDIEDLLFKVLVIGDFGVGKTSLIRRYTEGVFNPAYKITIGVDFSLKHLVYNGNKHITLQLWDIAGHERFGYMTRVYYKYATAAVIVYDLSRPATLHSVLKWKADLAAKVELPNGRPLPVLLVANKCDPGLPAAQCPLSQQLLPGAWLRRVVPYLGQGGHQHKRSHALPGGGSAGSARGLPPGWPPRPVAEATRPPHDAVRSQILLPLITGVRRLT